MKSKGGGGESSDGEGGARRRRRGKVELPYGMQVTNPKP
jgi:hypothetical protein